VREWEQKGEKEERKKRKGEVTRGISGEIDRDE
jgi:hypothetical protein